MWLCDLDQSVIMLQSIEPLNTKIGPQRGNQPGKGQTLKDSSR